MSAPWILGDHRSALRVLAAAIERHRRTFTLWFLADEPVPDGPATVKLPVIRMTRGAQQAQAQARGNG